MERIAKQQYISLHHNATTDGVIVPDKERRIPPLADVIQSQTGTPIFRRRRMGHPVGFDRSNVT